MYKVTFRFVEVTQEFDVFEFEDGEKARKFGLFLKRLARRLNCELEIAIERNGQKI